MPVAESGVPGADPCQPWSGMWGGESIVITGISGRLPESDNLAEFKEHLFNGDDMLTTSDGRWPKGYFGLPPRMGKIKDISQFDATFFGVHPKQAAHMDPQIRMLLEVTYEAIVDAGYNPQSLRGTNTGVYVGCGMSETQDGWSHDLENTEGYVPTGCHRSMFSGRINYFFDFKGPSIAMDTACSSASIAMHQAYQAIRTGICEAAVIGGMNINLRPGTSYQYKQMGMMGDACKAFDASVSGYCRSEGITAVFIQKQSAARRIYAELVHSKTNSDGYKEQGITYPSGADQGLLIQDVYKECGVDPRSVAYVEAHGTGTAAGDPEELNSIANSFCAGRTGPLLVGSVKSNAGHTEFGSGLTSLAKVLIAMEEGYIPANLHFKSPNPAIPALLDGRLKVVSEHTPWTGGYVGINSFGFGGANSHIVIKSSPKDSRPTHPAAKLPRLATFAARTEEGVDIVLQQCVKHQDNIYFQRLLLDNANVPGNSHPYRGYVTLNKENKVQEIAKSPSEKRPVWFIFAGMGCQWGGMGRDMMQIPAFRDSIMRSDAALRPHGVSVIDLIQKGNDKTFDELINSLVGILSIQMALTDVLKSIGVEPEGMVGHSAGEMACAYADGGLTAEETILSAYWRGQCMKDALKVPGAMAAVGLTWEEAHKRCPPGVVPACHNAIGTVTISGPAEKVANFVEVLKNEGVFAKAVQSNGGAFHSYMMEPSEKIMLDAMRKVITHPKPRTKRWISSSIPEDKWDTELAEYSSAEYHVNNVVSTVLFQEALTHVPNNAIAIEIAPHGLLQALLKRSFAPGTATLSMMKRQHPDNVEFMFSNLGRMYLQGGNLNPLGMFQPVRLPVPPSTPMISPLVKWDHSQSWKVASIDDFMSGGASSSVCSFVIDASPQSPDHYLTDHKIDGRILFPATGYLVLAWKALAKVRGEKFETMPVAMEDIHIHRATILPAEANFKFEVSISPGTGRFEVTDNKALVVTGTIYHPREPALQMPKYEPHCDGLRSLDRSDIYKELRLRGYEYGPSFQKILDCTNLGREGNIEWIDDDWIPFMDAMLQVTVASKPGKDLILPTRIRFIRIDPAIHTATVCNTGDRDIVEALKVTVDTELGSTVSGGIEIVGLHTSVAPRRQLTQAPPQLEELHFIPYFEPNLFSENEELQQYAELCSTYVQAEIKRVLNSDWAGIPDRGLLKKFAAPSPGLIRSHEQQLVQALQDPRCTLIDMLHDVFSLERNENFPANVTDLLRTQRPNVLQDMLLGSLNCERAMKACADIVLENTAGKNVKVVEVGGSYGMLYRHMIPQMATHPDLNLDYYITEGDPGKVNHTDATNFAFKSAVWDLTGTAPAKIANADLVVLARSLHHQPNIQPCLESLKSITKDTGFILVLENTHMPQVPLGISGQIVDYNSALFDKEQRTVGPYCSAQKCQEQFKRANLDLVAMKSDGLMSSLFLCRKRKSDDPTADNTIINVSDLSFDWVDEVRTALCADDNNTIWLVCDSEPLSGIIGLVNCLREEDGGDRIRCMVSDKNLPWSEDSTEFKSIIAKDLVMNVHKDGQWGSYRFLPCHVDQQTVTTEHAYVNVLTRGDLASLRWIESPLKYFNPSESPDKELCSVYYTSLNFRDIMLATGKLPPDAIPGDLASQDCLLGMEFSGLDQSRRRTMGLLPAKGLASSVAVDGKFIWAVPDSWTLEEAASVPVVYTTAYYALVVRGQIQAGDRVLVHAGSGGVGQAAIAVALHYGCEVFTTVGTAEKQRYLMDRFPQLTERNFANSRDQSFEWDIIRATKGKGVDVILNSLAEEKLQASLRILAQHGRFLEIGKVDLSSNNPLGMGIFLKNITFHGILLDALFDDGNQDWLRVADLLRQGIREGAVTPLKTTTFDKEDVEGAFRYMAQGKHIGKVLIKIRNEETRAVLNPTSCSVKAIPRVSCDPNKSYIITGGLGGFGLELTQWLIQRGAKNLVLTSRSGIKNGYQSRCVRFWRDSGLNIIVSTSDVGQTYGAEQVFAEATSLAPVGGVFHLALVLKDCLMRNQTKERFQAVGSSKVVGTIHLDQISRRECSDSLDWFVVFSSFSSGRGTAGQANYGFANAFMERVCEARNNDGFPGLAIQWGLIGDVGVVTDMIGTDGVELYGMRPQKLASCLDTMEKLLLHTHPVVCSMVLAERTETKPQEQESSGLVHAVSNILGVKDVSTVNQDLTLGDLGLDSLMGVEVKQALERMKNIDLPMKEVRMLTFKKLFQIENDQ